MQVDPRANAGYVIAAYCLTAAILAGYGIFLLLRFFREDRK